MNKLKLFALAALALVGFAGAANAADTVLLATDDLVGISFWLISMGMAAATVFFFMKKKTVAAAIPIEINQNDIPTRSSVANRTVSAAFAAPAKPTRANAAKANNFSLFIKNSLFS